MKYKINKIGFFLIIVLLFLMLTTIISITTLHNLNVMSGDYDSEFFVARRRNMFKEKSQIAATNNVTQTVSKFCSWKNNDIDSVKCVYNFIIDNNLFNYTVTHDIIMPDNLLKTGGDCKSWSVFYMSIFNQMGYKSKSIHTDGHVYINVYNENFYCNVDQININCYNLKSVE